MARKTDAKEMRYPLPNLWKILPNEYAQPKMMLRMTKKVSLRFFFFISEKHIIS